MVNCETAGSVMRAPAAAPCVADWFTSNRIARLTWAFVFLGGAARLTRFLLRFPLWEDEAFLAYNLMNRDFAGLLQPLDYGQIAPLGYLWLQRALIGLFGFTEYTLRLSALAAGLASLLVFRRLVSLTLPPLARLFAVAVFAVSYPMIRYSAEAKVYGLDLFLSLTLIWLFLEWRRRPERTVYLWGLLALIPGAVFLSHPVVFLGGGVSLALARELRRRLLQRSRHTPCAEGPAHGVCRLLSTGCGGWAFWLGFNVLMTGAFVTHLALSTKAMGQDNGVFMKEYWNRAFPPVRELDQLPRWLLLTHAGDFLAYPLGSGAGGSTLTLAGVVFGLGFWLSQRRGTLLFLALVPLALNFVAAAWQRYPYGGHVKFGLYWAPLGTLLLGTALAAFATWLDGRRQGLPISGWIALALLALVAVGTMARDFSCPAKTLSDLRSRDFARWFWFTAGHDSEVVCLHADLGKYFSADATRKLNWSATYACNQRIYSPRHALGLAPDWDKVSPARPVRCVEYQVGDLPYDETGRQAWLADMASRFDLAGRARFALPRYDKHDRRLLCTDYIAIYNFVPKSSQPQVVLK